MASSADILYIPAMHQGYVNYLQQRDGPVGLLSEELVRETPRLERDIRAISSRTMAGIVEVVCPRRVVQVVTAKSLGRFSSFESEAGTIYMPDEDVSHVFADTYLGESSVVFEPVFLRWDRQISLAELAVNPDRIISTNEVDNELMQIARTEAENSYDWWRQIGAVIVTKSEEIIKGHNRPCPTEDYTLDTFGDPRSNFDAGERIDLQKNIHAEAGVIAWAARNGVALDGSKLVVTTFPCPTCAKLIAEAGISRVYYQDGYSLLDAEDIFKAKGIEIVLIQQPKT